MRLQYQRYRRTSWTASEVLEGRCLLSSITVTTAEDSVVEDGQVSLREAVRAANDDVSVDGSAQGDGVDTIVFGEFDGPLQLDPSLGALQIFESVVIRGHGHRRTVLDLGGVGTAIEIAAPGIDLQLNRIRIKQATEAINKSVGEQRRPDLDTSPNCNKSGVGQREQSGWTANGSAWISVPQVSRRPAGHGCN